MADGRAGAARPVHTPGFVRRPSAARARAWRVLLLGAGVGVGLGAGAGPAHAQALAVGILGGISRTTLGGRDAGAYDARTTGTVGGMVSYRLRDPLALRLDALYTQKGGEAPAVEGTGGVRLTYLEVPLLLQATLPHADARQVRPYVLAGPALAFRLRCQLDAEVAGATRRLACDDPLFGGEARTKPVDVGLVVGAGTDLALGRTALRLEARYVLGLSSIDDTPAHADVKNRALSVLVGLSYAVRR